MCCFVKVYDMCSKQLAWQILYKYRHAKKYKDLVKTGGSWITLVCPIVTYCDYHYSTALNGYSDYPFIIIMILYIMVIMIEFNTT